MNMRGAPRVSSPILAVASVACVVAGVVTTVTASAEAVDSAAIGIPLLHRKLLSHNIENFRKLSDGGAYNALNGDADIADQVTATTCLPKDDFVRARDGQFILGGKSSILPPLFRTSTLYMYRMLLFSYTHTVCRDHHLIAHNRT